MSGLSKLNPFSNDFWEGETQALPGPQLKETPWGSEGRGYLQELLRQTAPLQEIAGMTGVEQDAQGVLGKYVRGELFRDPTKSPEWAGYRRVSQEMEDQAVSREMRRGNMSGMFRSSPAMVQGLRKRAGFVSDRRSKLGQLYSREMERHSPTARLAAASAYGGLPRNIQQQRYGAKYQQQMFPYNQQSRIAQSLMGYQPWQQPQFYQQPSMFSQLAGPAGEVLGSYLGRPQ